MPLTNPENWIGGSQSPPIHYEFVDTDGRYYWIGVFESGGAGGAVQGPIFTDSGLVPPDVLPIAYEVLEPVSGNSPSNAPRVDVFSNHPEDGQELIFQEFLPNTASAIGELNVPVPSGYTDLSIVVQCGIIGSPEANDWFYNGVVALGPVVQQPPSSLERYLEKPEIFEFIPGTAGSPGHPGHPGSPAVPARCTTTTVQTTETTTQFIPVNQIQSSSGYSQASPVFSSTQVNEFGQPLLLGYNVTFESGDTRQVRTCFPAQPAVPPTPPVPSVPPTPSEWRLQRRLGWNSGANSILRLGGDVRVQFTPLPARTVAVGLSRQRQGEHYRAMDFAMVFRGEFYEIHEQGTLRFGPVAYTVGERFGIARVSGRARFYRGEQLVHQGQLNVPGSMVVTAALYAAGDRVV